mmetsp:Transcript_21793/g.40807  ORF Transcript_21793/g.40807 Transcript_21793/m.40807 type:complete len:225 (-) Transcript_21793:1920-2594(-)
MLFESANRLSGESNSATLPESMTKMRVESMIVFRRWAIVITVRSVNISRTRFWSRRSVSLSSIALASSSIRRRDLRKRARATQINWRWPSETFSPPSTSSWSSSPTNWVSWTARRVSLSSSSVHSLKGSRLKRSDDWKTTGLCGIIAKRFRSSLREMFAILIPSTTMVPWRSSMTRSKVFNIVDFADPVRPQTPMRSPGWIDKEIPWITSGPSRYPATTFENST